MIARIAASQRQRQAARNGIRKYTEICEHTWKYEMNIKQISDTMQEYDNICVLVWNYVNFGRLDVYFGCLDVYFVCLDLYFGYLDLSFECLDLYFGCAGGRADGRTDGRVDGVWQPQVEERTRIHRIPSCQR